MVFLRDMVVLTMALVRLDCEAARWLVLHGESKSALAGVRCVLSNRVA